MLVWGKARAGSSAAASSTHTARPQPIAAAPRSSAPAGAGGGTGGSSGPTRGRRRPRTSSCCPPPRAGRGCGSQRGCVPVLPRRAPCAVGWLYRRRELREEGSGRTAQSEAVSFALPPTCRVDAVLVPSCNARKPPASSRDAMDAPECLLSAVRTVFGNKLQI